MSNLNKIKAWKEQKISFRESQLDEAYKEALEIIELAKITYKNNYIEIKHYSLQQLAVDTRNQVTNIFVNDGFIYGGFDSEQTQNNNVENIWNFYINFNN